MEVDEWDQVFAINVRGTMLMCRTVARRWVDAGIKGAIITVSSVAARSARAGGSHYCSSKAAVSMMTEVFALELGPYGIRVNAVAPGLIVDTVVEAEDDKLHPYVNMMLRGTPLRRTGDPREIADAVVFLASDKSSWTTGAVLEITGGSHCGRTHMPYTGDMR
jgi:NAD(P)-dependent dehydrogenase (short-subunit alcohol dehydrogenase family)